jgi:tetratricopeptide (TPR) repeat protein
LNLVDQLDAPSQKFLGELYSTELKALVGEMLSDDNPDQYLDRMTQSMERLREVYQGPESQTKLTQTYMRLATNLKEQLDQASPARKSKLIQAFQVMLERISDATDNQATLRWVGQTLSSMGESLMLPGETKATAQAAELISQSISTFQALDDQENVTTAYLLGRSQRLVGRYKDAIDTFDELLQEHPLMLEAQIEAAKAYESWAASLPPKIAYKAYRAALEGARPGDDGKNTIWGWADISSKTSKQIKRSENFKEKFFESRYHVALCLYLMGKAAKRDSDLRKAIKVIREAATLFPDLGGPESRNKYDALMKEAQRAVGDPAKGIAQS